MCVACVEYIKGNLRLKEFKNAIRETAAFGDNKEHAKKIQEIVYDHQGDEKDLKEKIQKLD